MTPNPGNSDPYRPTRLAEYIGQERMKRRLLLRIEAARNQVRPLGHILLCAPPGAGKTALAQLIASLVGEPLLAMNLPYGEAALVDAITDHRGILFLDEIHDLGKLQELLLSVLEFGELHRRNGDVISNDWLTILGATTERHLVLPALYRRFDFTPAYEPYAVAELTAMATSMAKKVGIKLPPAILDAIGQAAGGKPHMVGKMVSAADRIMAVYKGDPTIEEILDQCGTTADGLTESHIEYLLALLKFRGTAGQDKIGQRIGFKTAILNELEQLLVDKNLITFGGKGRELTPAGRRRAQAAA